MSTASFLAVATMAFLKPFRVASRTAQDLVARDFRVLELPGLCGRLCVIKFLAPAFGQRT